MKIKNDKYYTSPELAKYCIEKTKEIIGEKNIVEYIEPSAGQGVFLDFLDKPYIAYDIEPEDKRITKQDYLDVDLKYKKGRCVIGNPPFGERMSLAIKFYKKSIQLGDYIGFILPISQHKNSRTLYEFDLIYSEDLGKQLYTDRKLHCCLNIYKRNINGFNKKPINKLKDVTIIRQDSRKYDSIQNYDIRMCYWGDGSAGRILTNTDKKYSGEYKIIINNEDLKEQIKNIILNYDWSKEAKNIAMKRIKQYHIIDVLRKYVPNIE